jgi:hypothetical protein
MSEMLSATAKKENLKAALEYYEKIETMNGYNEVERRFFMLLDQRILRSLRSILGRNKEIFI